MSKIITEFGTFVEPLKVSSYS